MSSSAKEEYVIPSVISSALTQMQSHSSDIKYNCAQCAVSFTLGKNDVIRCKECGHRVLYKMRKRKTIQFEAR